MSNNNKSFRKLNHRNDFLYDDYVPDTKFHAFLYWFFLIIACVSVCLMTSINIEDPAPLSFVFKVYGGLLIGFIGGILGISYLKDPFDFKAHVAAIYYVIHDYIMNENDLKKYDDIYTSRWISFKNSYYFIDRIKIMYENSIDDYYMSH